MIVERSSRPNVVSRTLFINLVVSHFPAPARAPRARLIRSGCSRNVQNASVGGTLAQTKKPSQFGQDPNSAGCLKTFLQLSMNPVVARTPTVPAADTHYPPFELPPSH